MATLLTGVLFVFHSVGWLIGWLVGWFGWVEFVFFGLGLVWLVGLILSLFVCLIWLVYVGVCFLLVFLLLLCFFETYLV